MLQIGLPGTQEFLVLLTMLVFYGGLAVLAIKAYRYFFGNGEEVAALKQRVALLEHKVEALEDELGEDHGDGSGQSAGSGEA